MGSIYETVSTIGFIVAVLCFGIAVFLWFHFDIRSEFQVISGRGERRARREPHEVEEKNTGLSSFGVRMTERMRKTSARLDQSTGDSAVQTAGDEGTAVLADDGLTSGLERTTVLEEEPAVSEDLSTDDRGFILLEEISWMQTKERITEEEE